MGLVGKRLKAVGYAPLHHTVPGPGNVVLWWQGQKPSRQCSDSNGKAVSAHSHSRSHSAGLAPEHGSSDHSSRAPPPLEHSSPAPPLGWSCADWPGTRRQNALYAAGRWQHETLMVSYPAPQLLGSQVIVNNQQNILRRLSALGCIQRYWVQPHLPAFFRLPGSTRPPWRWTAHRHPAAGPAVLRRRQWPRRLLPPWLPGSPPAIVGWPGLRPRRGTAPPRFCDRRFQVPGSTCVEPGT